MSHHFRTGRRPSDGDIDHGIDVSRVVDPEARIALLKAQREKERDKEIAMKEMQVCHVLVKLINIKIILYS